MKNTEKNTGRDNLILWKKGDKSPNPSGRPLGQRDYATIYKEALIKLAEINKKTPDELETEILSTGLLNARKGNYQFYKDVLDRIHGSANSNVNLTGEVTINLISYKGSSKK